MRRNVDLSEISDGVLYEPEDMVKTGCHDCEGCSACCRNMEALVLDPLDVYRLTQGLGRPFEDFLDRELELGIVDQMILPRMRMAEEDGACSFLNEAGRCGIHVYRPGICRLFPLGRYYHDGDFSYILQVNECRKSNRYKVRVKQWVDEPEPGKNRRFINAWHDFLRQMETAVPKLTEESRKQVLMYVMKLFYMAPYPEAGFYEEFDRRMTKARQVLGSLLEE